MQATALRCPQCGKPVKDEGLCVGCWDGRQENREKLAAYQRRYYQENREKLAAYKRRYWQENREKLAAYQRRYRQSKRHERMAEELRAAGHTVILGDEGER